MRPQPAEQDSGKTDPPDLDSRRPFNVQLSSNEVEIADWSAFL